MCSSNAVMLIKVGSGDPVFFFSADVSACLASVSLKALNSVIVHVCHLVKACDPPFIMNESSLVKL